MELDMQKLRIFVKNILEFMSEYIDELSDDELEVFLRDAVKDNVEIEADRIEE